MEITSRHEIGVRNEKTGKIYCLVALNNLGSVPLVWERIQQSYAKYTYLIRFPGVKDFILIYQYSIFSGKVDITSYDLKKRGSNGWIDGLDIDPFSREWHDVTDHSEILFEVIKEAGRY